MCQVNVNSLGQSTAKGQWPPSTVLHSSDELVELSQWQCHDDKTINIVIYNYYYSTTLCVSKKDTDVIDYNFNKDHQIFRIFEYEYS